MKLLRWIGLLLMGVVFVAFALANTQSVVLHLPLYQEVALELPFYLFFFLTMLLGVTISGVWTVYARVRRAGHAMRLAREKKRLEGEVAKLKTSSQS